MAFDAANLAAAAARLGGVFDFGQAITDFAADGRPFLAVAVVLYQRLTTGLEDFFRALEHLGIRVVPSKRENVAGQEKAADDTALAAEAVFVATLPGVSELIVASGDGDLTHAVRVARRRCPVTVAAFAGTLSQRLRAAADRTVILTDRHVVTP